MIITGLVTGVKNTTADFRSRDFYDSKEYPFNLKFAKPLVEKFDNQI